MTRVSPEWIGNTDDAAIPARVRVRVFERHGGVCHLSRRKITASDLWDVDHVVALVNGGKHCESNLAPALRDKHREKTKADVAIKSKNYQVRAKHLGLKPKGRPMPGSRASGLRKRMNGTVERRT